MLKWSAKSKKRALIASLIAAAAVIPAMAAAHERFLPFWQIALPLLVILSAFGFLGLSFTQIERERELRALPGIRFPFGILRWQLAAYLYFAFFILLLYFSVTVIPYGPVQRVLYSMPSVLICLAAVLFLTIGGGQLILNKRPEGRIYRDAVSPSRFSRQDQIYSLAGSWDDGLIYGWMLFPYAAMRSRENIKKGLVIRGKQDDESYVLILYTPRVGKLFQPLLEAKQIPYRNEEDSSSE